jgi:endoglucanase
MPEMPDQYAGTWIANHYESYPQEGTAERIRQLLDIAVAFQEERNVPLFCGEFGVYQPFSDPDDRNVWYEVVRTKLEDHQIAWTMWDYHGGFGIFTPGGQGLFDHDLDIPLVNALGLNAPDQHPFEIKPDESGFVIYDDFIGQDIEYAGYSSGGMVDLYGSQAHNGQFAIEWNNPGQYSHIGFNFRPDKDLSLLVQAGYRIEFAVKGELPNTPFDIRFVDSKVDAEDHPWRMRYICDDELFVRDGEWHMISIPLSELEEHGSWDNNTWYEPEGLFDWTAIDRFEIVAEYTEAEASSFMFDDIKVTGGATSTVQDYLGSGMVTAYPNPTSTTMQIVTTTPESGYIEVIGSNGIIVLKVACRLSDRIEIDLRDLPPGNYVVHRISGDDVSIGLIPIIKI